MAYSLGNGIWNGVFAVPNTVTDKHLKIASGLSVKVLLLILRHAGELQASELASMLGQSVSDIQDALNYWVQCGVIFPACANAEAETEAANPAEPEAPVHNLTPNVRYQEVIAPSAPSTDSGEAASGAAEEAPRKVSTISSRRPRLTTGEINDMAHTDENIVYLLQEAQSVLGKTLTPVSTETIMALYSYHGMQPDLILMLMHYCVSIGKESMRYMEKMAADWLDRGIDSHEKAEAEILRLTHRDSAEAKVKAAFGIYNRSLITSEKKYIQKWLEEYRQDIQLISLAYERSVEIKGSLSFPYINGILTNWHNKGVTTTAQAVQEIKENRPAPKQQPASSSYDMGELENMITYGDI